MSLQLWKKKMAIIAAMNKGYLLDVSGNPAVLTAALKKPLQGVTVYGASGGVGDATGNLYDITAYPLSQGRWVSAETGGDAISSTGYACTRSYIPCSDLAGKTITLNKRPGGNTTGFAFYDSSKGFLSGQRNNGGTAGLPWAITVPAGAVYMRFTVPANDTKIMLAEGSYTAATMPPYEPYGYKIPVLLGDKTLGDVINDFKAEHGGEIQYLENDTYVRILVAFGRYRATDADAATSLLWSVADTQCMGDGAVSLICETNTGNKSFDAAEPTNPDTNIQANGSNRWKTSNLRQWLQSNGAANDWFEPQTEYDTAPTYANANGFLRDFTADEKAAIVAKTNNNDLATVDGGGTETTQDNVWIMSIAELGMASAGAFEIFNDDLSREWTAGYSTRSIYNIAQPHYLKTVRQTGSMTSGSAKTAYRIRLGINLSSDTPVVWNAELDAWEVKPERAAGNKTINLYTPQQLELVGGGYTQLEYIESTGTQYIDTGVIADQDTRIVCDFEITELPSSGSAAVFGARSAASSRGYMFSASITSERWTSQYSGTGKQAGVPDTNRHTVDFDKNKVYLDSTQIVSFTSETFTTPWTVKLFAIAYGTTEVVTFKSKMKIYSCRVYDGDELIRSYVPAKRISDSAVGLYDTVNGVFYTDAAGGSFAAGAEAGLMADTLTADISAKTAALTVGGAITDVSDLQDWEQDFTLAKGDNTVSVGTTVQPSAVEWRYLSYSRGE